MKNRWFPEKTGNISQMITASVVVLAFVGWIKQRLQHLTTIEYVILIGSLWDKRPQYKGFRWIRKEGA